MGSLLVTTMALPRVLTWALEWVTERARSMEMGWEHWLATLSVPQRAQLLACSSAGQRVFE